MRNPWIWQIGRVRRKSSWVTREISRFSHARDSVGADLQAERGRHVGRRARSDQVAACLLHHGLTDNGPVRHRDQIARNRRRVIGMFVLVVGWWVCGRFLG